MCVDPATGCPYYWEQVTNQVCWEPPPGFIPVPVTIPTNVSENRVVSAAVKTFQEKKLEARRSAKKLVTKSLRQKSPSSEEEKFNLLLHITIRNLAVMKKIIRELIGDFFEMRTSDVSFGLRGGRSIQRPQYLHCFMASQDTPCSRSITGHPLTPC